MAPSGPQPMAKDRLLHTCSSIPSDRILWLWTSESLCHRWRLRRRTPNRSTEEDQTHDAILTLSKSRHATHRPRRHIVLRIAIRALTRGKTRGTQAGQDNRVNQDGMRVSSRSTPSHGASDDHGPMNVDIGPMLSTADTSGARLIAALHPLTTVATVLVRAIDLNVHSPSPVARPALAAKPLTKPSSEPRRGLATRPSSSVSTRSSSDISRTANGRTAPRPPPRRSNG